jgi:DNA-binding transcriptional regulator of glucitol operon
MSSVPARPRWRILFTPRWLGWHLFAVVAFLGMLWLGDWQFHRAESGNALSWAYTFEWPIFAVFGAVFWVKTVRDELKPPAAPAEAAEIELPASARAGAATPGPDGQAGRSGPASEEADDPELAAYNAYLARLNQQVKGHGKWHGLR